MIELIRSPYVDNFFELCSKAKNSIKLCAPFVKSDVIATVLSNKAVSCSVGLITKVSLRNFHQKASDVEALRHVVTNGGQVYNCSNLHSKVYIFDDTTVWVTSANLTSNALRRNEECGILAFSEEITIKAINYYDYLRQREDVSIVSTNGLNEINKLLDRIPALPTLNYPHISLSEPASPATEAISSGLTGWKKAVFLALATVDETFTTQQVKEIAELLQTQFPNNNNREAKVRQQLQELRDLGLVEFTSPGTYKKLWS